MRSLFGPARNTFVIILVLGVTASLVAGTSAAFNATIGKTGNFSATALAVPTPTPLAGASFTATASNNDVKLAWTNYVPPVPASPDPGVTGFAIFRAAAVGNNCTTTPPAYGNVPIKTLAASATSYTDAAVVPGTFAAGVLICYQLATAWTAPGQASPIWFSGNSASQTNPTASQRGGFLAIAVDFGNGGVMTAACIGGGCTLDVNDTIRITFNQATNQPVLNTANRGNLCEADATNIFYLGVTWDSNNQICGTAPKIGSLAGGTFNLGGQDDSPAVQTYTWNAAASSCAPAATPGTVLCIQSRAAGQTDPPITATPADWRLTMATSAVSGITSAGGTAICAGATPGCQPIVPPGHLP